jgi:pyrimidine-nucleoside phosphorylase
MNIVDLITKKRDGNKLKKEEIEYIINRYVDGQIKDYQMSAFLMATYFQGMDDEEATYLALAMKDSGDTIDLSSIEGIKVDKHSTGGVGDKVTLILGPMLACHGVKFAKMSGRGLGHTGGTIDKLESIPGYQVEKTVEAFIEQVSRIGIAIVGQSGDIAPADKLLYALRDVTATVEVIPLIAASIMSKKLASGADAICLDVKVGNGAFMKTVAEAKVLAKLMVDIGINAHKKMSAILTSMDQPLGHKIGNGLEVFEALQTLKGEGPEDLVEVTTTIGAYLLMDAKIEENFEIAKKMCLETLNSKEGFKMFKKLVEAQGGNSEILDHPEQLLSENKHYVFAKKSGYITKINALDIGKAAMRLGAGRETKEDHILMDVGIDLHAKIGNKVTENDIVATLYVQNQGIDEAIQLVKEAIEIGDEIVKSPLIIETIRP